MRRFLLRSRTPMPRNVSPSGPRPRPPAHPPAGGHNPGIRPHPMPHPTPHPMPHPMPHPAPGGFADHGRQPYVIDINRATINNQNYRTTIWTGKYLQSTLMSIPPGGEIGLEVHHDTDQFLRIERGQGIVQMGSRRNHLNIRQPLFDDFAVFVPAGTWHNITNIGNTPLKIYSIYAPPHHPPGTVHATKAIADMMGD